MRVVLDTNLLLPSLSPRSKTHWLFQSKLTEKLTLCVTTDILDECAEIFQEKLSLTVPDAFMDLILTLPNLVLIEKYYFWQAIHQDTDDNKFLDCAVAARAKYLISDDNHFKELRKKSLFEVKIVRLVDFKSLFCKIQRGQFNIL